MHGTAKQTANIPLFVQALIRPMSQAKLLLMTSCKSSMLVSNKQKCSMTHENQTQLKTNLSPRSLEITLIKNNLELNWKATLYYQFHWKVYWLWSWWNKVDQNQQLTWFACHHWNTGIQMTCIRCLSTELPLEEHLTAHPECSSTYMSGLLNAGAQRERCCSFSL